MPASRILEGRLPEQRLSGHIFFWRRNHNPQPESKRDIKGEALA
jgi:hypothetical protein